MPYIIPSLSKIRDDLLRDIKNQLPQADIGVDSDYYVRASSVASCVEGLYQHQSWIVKQIFPDSADTEFLEWHCAIRGLRRKPAAFAQGSAQATGVVGAVIPAGAMVKTETGKRFTVLASAVIPEQGMVQIVLQALDIGKSGNTTESIGSFVQIDSDIESQVTQLVTHGGVEQETDAALLGRLLELLRRPPAGGNQYDYKNWALSVPGVTAAYVYPLRRGLGTVDIAIVSDDDIPSQETINAVQAYIDDVRPVTAKGALVVAPNKRQVDISMQVRLEHTHLDVFTQDIIAALKGLFEGITPGQPLVKSKIEALISNHPNVLDRVLLSPTQNMQAIVNHDVIEWLVLGEVEVSLL